MASMFMSRSKDLNDLEKISKFYDTIKKRQNLIQLLGEYKAKLDENFLFPQKHNGFMSQKKVSYFYYDEHLTQWQNIASIVSS